MVFALLFGEEAGEGYYVGVYFFGADRAFAVGAVCGHGKRFMLILSLRCTEC